TSKIRSRASRASSMANMTSCPSPPSTWWAPSRRRWKRPAAWQPKRREPRIASGMDEKNMGDQVQFELVTPERLVVSEPVDMVVVPGSEGDFGVLPGHAPLISTVRPGVIETYAGKAVKDRIFVAGGFAEVTRERCTVLAEEAVPVAELDRSQIESEAAAAREDIGLARDAGERAAAERALAVAEAKLQLIQRTAQ